MRLPSEIHYTPAQLARREELRSRLNVAQSLLEARVESGLTQAELGKLAGTNQARVSELEGLRGNPRFDTLDRVASAVGLMVQLIPRKAAEPFTLATICLVDNLTLVSAGVNAFGLVGAGSGPFIPKRVTAFDRKFRVDVGGSATEVGTS